MLKSGKYEELQTQIDILDIKLKNTKGNISEILLKYGYKNAKEFYTELFKAREEKTRYEEDYKDWLEQCINKQFDASNCNSIFNKKEMRSNDISR